MGGTPYGVCVCVCVCVFFWFLELTQKRSGLWEGEGGQDRVVTSLSLLSRMKNSPGLIECDDVIVS